MKVVVFGTGYVGLVQGAVLAEIGHDVICVDNDSNKIERLVNGEIPIYEPGLEDLVRQNYRAGRLSFTTDAVGAVKHGTVIFIAVGTPPGEDGSADLQYVLAVSDAVAENMSDYKVVVNKSTVPVGTADKVERHIKDKLASRGLSDLEFDVVSNPEFLKEGSAVSDCMRPDRIVVGTRSLIALNILRELYSPFNRNHEKIIAMDARSAELTKYAANCLLATKISFMNEMSNIAEILGGDIEKVRLGVGADPRIGHHFIYAGAGYGGSCFPKDVRALIRASADIDFDPVILSAVESRNNEQKKILLNKINKHFKGELNGVKIALWGLSFKPNTDDIREAPSLTLITGLLGAGAKIIAYDPEAMRETRKFYENETNISFSSTKEDAVNEADALVIVTEWQEFKSPDFSSLKERMNTCVIFDGRNLFSPDRMLDCGVEYYSIGRGQVLKYV